jgi:hypothetical protein
MDNPVIISFSIHAGLAIRAIYTVFTVEALLTHTPRSQLQAMGYERVWAFRMLLKIDTKKQ